MKRSSRTTPRTVLSRPYLNAWTPLTAFFFSPAAGRRSLPGGGRRFRRRGAGGRAEQKARRVAVEVVYRAADVGERAAAIGHQGAGALVEIIGQFADRFTAWNSSPPSLPPARALRPSISCRPCPSRHRPSASSPSIFSELRDSDEVKVSRLRSEFLMDSWLSATTR